MSAFILEQESINTLISYFVAQAYDDALWCKADGEYNYMTPDKAPRVASILMQENVRSVNRRYNDNEVVTYTYTNIPESKKRDISYIVDIINSLDYNSCECDNYYTTEAYYIICNMRKHLLDKICATQNTKAFEF